MENLNNSKEIHDENSPIPAVDDGQTTDNPHKPNNPKGSSRKYLWVIIALVIIAAAITAYFVNRNSNENTQNQTSAIIKKDIPLLRIGQGDGPINVFYPAAPFTDGSLFVNRQVFEGLVAFKDSTQIVPNLATSWTNPDNTTWIFDLRQNVKFHTGRTMTADDVKYSLDKFADTAFDGTFGGTIKNTEVLGPNRIKITTNGPDPILLHRLAYLYIIDSKSKEKNSAVNGTGPYAIKDGTDPTKDKVTDLVASDNYWGGHVYTRELKIYNTTDLKKAANDLINHTYDAYFTFDTSEIKALKAAGIATHLDETDSVDILGLNIMPTDSPLANLKFRQALNVGLDRSALLKKSGNHSLPAGQYLTQDIPGYLPSLKAPVYSTEQAKKLITDSKVKLRPLKLTYTSGGQNDALAKEIRDQYALIGVTINLDPQPDFESLVSTALGGKTDMYYVALGSSLADASDIYSGTFIDSPNYDNPKVDELMKKANQTIDASQRLVLLQQVTQLLADDAAGVPLTSGGGGYYAQTSNSYVLHRDIPGDTIGIYFWKIYQQ